MTERERIRFGTSGWRGIIARDFTWDRVDRVVDAIGAMVSEDGGSSFVVGGDTRFLSPELARSAAERLAGCGFRVVLADRPTPTPALSHAARAMGLDGIINFTASHNPPVYNGIKFSPGHGGPAPGKVTSRVEELYASGASPEPGSGSVEEADLTADFRKALLGRLRAGAFADSGLRAVYDPFTGTGFGILDRMLGELGAAVRVINGPRDPLFAGRSHPEPNEAGLAQLSEEVLRSGASVGLANDGDADRFGLVGEDGAYISPHDFLPLLLEYLVEERGMEGTVVRSVSTGSLLDRVARRLGLEVEVTPVGFKHLGGRMLQGGVLLAGEESGGLSIGGHVPEKDGVLACLLAAELIAAGGRGLAEQLADLWDRYGRLYDTRIDLPLTPETKRMIGERFFDSTPAEVAGRSVLGQDRRDGVRLDLEGGCWVLVRLSGTEPLARVYAEAPSRGEMEELCGWFDDLFGGGE
jgi:phosphoglucomutase